MNTVSDYQAKGVVFVEGDVVTHSADPESCVTIARINHGHYLDGNVESFAWRKNIGEPHTSMMIQVVLMNGNKTTGLTMHFEWDGGGANVVDKWKPMLDVPPGVSDEPMLTGAGSSQNTHGVLSTTQPLVHVGAELSYGDSDCIVELVKENGYSCITRCNDGLLEICYTTSLTPRKSPEQVELERLVDEACSFLKKPDEDDKRVCEALIKAGYRKVGV